MKRIYIALLAMIVIGILSSCALPGSGGSKVLNLKYTSNCHASTGQPTTCTVTLTNDSSSTGDFNWSATSSVGGVVFDPSSGTLSAGASSDPINATIPAGECPFKLTFSDSGGTSIDVNSNTC
jgi:hypothetical protein